MAFQLPDELIFLRNSRLPQKTTTELMTGKVVVLTGGTSGVGLAALKELAKGGATVILVSRNLEKAKQVADKVTADHPIDIHHVYADFSKLDTIREAATSILQQFPRIHVLINSAGIYSTKKRYTEEGYEMVFCVNHLAPLLFTKLLLPRLQESAPSRIVQVNSEGHRFAGVRLKDLNFRRRIYTGLRGYGASKTAQLFSVWELAKELEGTSVTINAMHPGAVRSNIGHNSGFLYRFWLRYVMWHFLKDPSLSGQSIYYLVADKSLEQTSGLFYNLTIEEPPARHARKGHKKSRPLYEESLRYLQLNISKESDFE